MALQGLMGDSSYSVATLNRYDKANCNIGIEVATYADSSKQTYIGSTHIITNAPTALEVQAVNQTQVPNSPTIGHFYAVGANASGAFEGQSGQVAKYTADGWVFYSDKHLWHDEKIYQWSGSAWVHNPYVLEGKVFNKYFSLSQIGGADKDILKACYTYLKSLPAFENCTDV